MHSQLFIASRIKVGFQKRSGTFTDKLGYVIYYDAKNKLRKETSWEGWRDKAIAPEEFDNTPQTGFTLNKGIIRGGDWFSKTTTKVRVWDPRGFEIEISVVNLMQILMHSDVSKRDIQQACVYAWFGTELILLPTNSAEYESSVKHTAKQSVKFSAKDLVVGHTYNVKQGDHQVVYLGRHDYYSQVDQNDKRIDYSTHNGFKQVLKPKKHIFYQLNNNSVCFTEPSSLIAGVADETVHPNLPKFMDDFYRHIQSQPIKGMKVNKARDNYYNCWLPLSDTEFVNIRTKFETKHNYSYGRNMLRADMYTGFTTNVTADRVAVFHPETGVFEMTYNDPYGGRYGRDNNTYTVNSLSLNDQRIVDLVKRFEVEYEAKAKAYYDAEIEKCRKDTQYYPFGWNGGDSSIRPKMSSEFKGGDSFIAVMADGKTCSNTPTTY